MPRSDTNGKFKVESKLDSIQLVLQYSTVGTMLLRFEKRIFKKGSLQY
jgi:hypothetical protein